MDKENNYTTVYKDKISHDLALEIIEEIALTLNVNLYGLVIGRDHHIGAEIVLGFLVNDVKRMKADNKEYYELKNILKKVIS